MKNGSKLNMSRNESVNTIDITSLKETGEDLKRAIVNAVKDTQSAVLLVPLPDTLIMTAAQYIDLDTFGDLVGAYHSRQRVYITRDKGDVLNAMDVVVKDPYNLPPETSDSNTVS